jgi:hypothetical protein
MTLILSTSAHFCEMRYRGARGLRMIYLYFTDVFASSLL